MAIQITVPTLGWSMDEGAFVEWLKHDGELVRRGDSLFSVEGDKTMQEIESIGEGYLRFFPGTAQPGDVVKAGQLLAFLLAKDELLPERALPEAGMNQPESGNKPAISTQDDGVSERIIAFSPVRRRIAARMAAANQQTAPVTLTTQVDATELVALRKAWRLVRSSNNGLVPGHTDIIIKLVGAALERHPRMQAQWRPEGLFIPDGIHIGVAVDTDAGLIVPVIRDVRSRTVFDVAAANRELIDLARSRRLTPVQTRGGTFTVTTLGSLGIDAFTPIINLPQSAILGIGRIALEPAVVGEQVVPRHRMWLSITFDHRVLDGAPVARFLSALKNLIEQPDMLR